MPKANIIKKKTISIHGVLDITNNGINIVLEDSGEPMSLADILQDFDNAEVSISVGESVDIA